MPNLSQIDENLLHNLDVLIVEIKKYKVAKKNEIDDLDSLIEDINDEEKIQEVFKKFPNMIYNASLSLQHYLYRLNEFDVLNTLPKEIIDGKEYIILNEPTEELDKYMFWVYTNGFNKNDGNGRYIFTYNKTKYQSFKFELSGTYKQSLKKFKVGNINCAFKENPNKPIFSMIYESLQLNKDSKQPQFYDIKTNSMIGKPFGFLLALLSKVYNIVGNKISDNEIIYRGQPIKKDFSEEDLRNIIESFSFDEARNELEKYRKRFHLPKLNENYNEDNIPRNFIIEDRSKLTKFDILQESHKNNTVLNKNDKENVELRSVNKDNKRIENEELRKDILRKENSNKLLEKARRDANDPKLEEQNKEVKTEILNKKFSGFINSREGKEKEILISHLTELIKFLYLEKREPKTSSMINKIDFNSFGFLYPYNISQNYNTFIAQFKEFILLMRLLQEEQEKYNNTNLIKSLNKEDIIEILNDKAAPRGALEKRLKVSIENFIKKQQSSLTSSKKELSNIKDKDREKIAKYKKEFLMKNSTLSKKLSPFK